MEELLTSYNEFVIISEEDKKLIEKDRKALGEYNEQDNSNRKAEQEKSERVLSSE